MTSRTQGILAALAGVLLSGCASIIDTFTGGDDGPDEAIEGNREQVLEIEEALVADAEAADRVITPPAARTLSVWSQTAALPTHAPQHLALAETVELAWEVNAGKGSSQLARIVAAPIVAGGRVFVLDTRATIHAFDVADGSALWSKQYVGQEVEREGAGFYWTDFIPFQEESDAAIGFGGGLGHDGDRLYLTSGFGFAAALDPVNGAEIWRTELERPARASPTVAGGRVYAITIDNGLKVLDAQTGVLLWTHQALEEPARLLMGASAAVESDYVIAPYGSGELVALDPETGRLLWADALALAGRPTAIAALNDIAGSPSIHRGLVVAANRAGRMTGIEARTGRRVWTRPVGSVHTPWVAGDVVFVLSTEQVLAAISLSDGLVVWATELPRYEKPEDRKGPLSWAGPVLAGGRLFAASSGEEMLEVDARTGAVLRTHELPGPVFTSPVVADETLFVYTDDARLLAFR